MGEGWDWRQKYEQYADTTEGAGSPYPLPPTSDEDEAADARAGMAPVAAATIPAQGPDVSAPGVAPYAAPYGPPQPYAAPPAAGPYGSPYAQPNQQPWYGQPYGQPHPGPYPVPGNRGRGFTITAFICGGIGLLFFPFILGPLGIIFGFVG